MPKSRLAKAAYLPNSQHADLIVTKVSTPKNAQYGRGLLVTTANQARNIANGWVKQHNLHTVVSFGLPEIDDRYNIWRVPIVARNASNKLGEIVISAKNSLILSTKTTSPSMIESRILQKPIKHKKKSDCKYILSALRNTIALGDSEFVLDELPAESVDLIFTSPPYYNAKPEYSDYISYNDYLSKLQKIIHKSHRVLRTGCFFVINVSPVLIRRSTRSESSKRLAVPFDVHSLFIKENFDFMDDIIWEKPGGAGWATGRGRRFAADRNPLQYKPVPITEYVLVYRKHSDHLIDWHLRQHPKQDLVKHSKITGSYDKYNIWKIKPAHTKIHPAIFPRELAEKIIRYYSFKNDVVLDPFAGVGTVAEAAHGLDRRFVVIDSEKKYVDHISSKMIKKLGRQSKDLIHLNYTPPRSHNTTLLDHFEV